MYEAIGLAFDCWLENRAELNITFKYLDSSKNRISYDTVAENLNFRLETSWDDIKTSKQGGRVFVFESTKEN